MLFAAESGTNPAIVFMIIVLIIAGGWLMYMYTFRTKDMLDILERTERINKERSERRKQTAKGAIKTGVALFKLFRRRG